MPLPVVTASGMQSAAIIALRVHWSSVSTRRCADINVAVTQRRVSPKLVVTLARQRHRAHRYR